MTKYHGVFGGDLDLAPFSMFDMPVDDAEKEWVMHGFLKTAAGHTLMGADVPSSMDLPPNGVVALTGDEPDVVRGWWDALAENGTIELPLKQAPWGDYFGVTQVVMSQCTTSTPSVSTMLTDTVTSVPVVIASKSTRSASRASAVRRVVAFVR